MVSSSLNHLRVGDALARARLSHILAIHRALIASRRALAGDVPMVSA